MWEEPSQPFLSALQAAWLGLILIIVIVNNTVLILLRVIYFKCFPVWFPFLPVRGCVVMPLSPDVGK